MRFGEIFGFAISVNIHKSSIFLDVKALAGDTVLWMLYVDTKKNMAKAAIFKFVLILQGDWHRAMIISTFGQHYTYNIRVYRGLQHYVLYVFFLYKYVIVMPITHSSCLSSFKLSESCKSMIICNLHISYSYRCKLSSDHSRDHSVIRYSKNSNLTSPKDMH